jgi:cbb3-type cytochrome oxidase maturation protein
MMMPLGYWAFVGWLLLITLMGVCALFWGWQSGQFKDIEAPKYRVLEEREPAPWPNRDRRRGRRLTQDDNGGEE